MQRERTCSEPGCDAKIVARGLCRKHYSAWHHAQDRGPCSIEGCEGRKVKRDLCTTHYTRLQRHGDASILVRPWRSPDRLCSVDGCDRPFLAKGMCGLHYDRVKTHGSIVKPPKKPSRARWSLDTHGYMVKYWPTHPNASKFGKVKQHTVVMAEMIGRPLRKGETVHHVNGIRHDNRPENLELWVRSHPPGQRVTDLVAFAEQILAEYGDLGQNQSR